MDSGIGINEFYPFKGNITLKFSSNGLPCILYFGGGVQKLIQSFLGGGSPLNHTGYPPDGTNGESEHGNINDKFGNGPQIGIVASSNNIKASDHNDK